MKSLLLLILGLSMASGALAQSLLSYPPKPAQQNTEERLRILGNPERFVAEPNSASKTGHPLLNKLAFEESSFKLIAEKTALGQTRLALSLLESLPNPSDAPADLKEWYTALAVELYSSQRKWALASQWGQSYQAQFPQGKHWPRVYFFWAKALNAQSQPLPHTELVDLNLISALGEAEAQELRDLLVNDALALGKIKEAFGYLEVPPGRLIEGYQRWSVSIISALEHLEDLDPLLTRFQAETKLVSRLYLRKVELLVLAQHFDEAQALLDDLQNKGMVEKEDKTELVGLGGYIESARQAKPYKIGVILPLSHPRFKALAQQTLDGLEIAVSRLSRPDFPLELVIKDSALDASGNKQAGQGRRDLIGDLVRQLVNEDQVIAIIGPLAKETSLAAGEAASPFKIPVISLSLTEGLGETLPFLFRFQRDQLHESQALARYSYDYLGARRYVVFYSPDKAGFARVSVFVDEIEKRGGQVVGVRPIDRHQVDFQEDFLSITGGFEPVSQKEREEMEAARDRLAPEIDFDAIFAPVDPFTLNILKQFANLYEADRVYFLAGHELNQVQSQLIEGNNRLIFADSYSEGGLYLQTLFEAHWREFNYRSRYAPPSSYGIFGYESLEILSGLLKDPATHNREALRNALARLKGFPVLSGKVTTSQTGELQKEVKLMRIKGDSQVELF
ncbi:MAG: hypothetical protein A2508_05810 [Candidatus Lambdaproteobacteria bacterium RIFOXYD12_FULL_49_8]|uniref:Leucine-binding protein domain-containing protein n=1 Tax=Candidatus Lambdaproteobacteria bacterium RIFOXYD2_FULL_50_16 TaxID=1817772 RepID=A0A1F6GFV5_9PROT|nr:MAG: hypothetical protein A2527_02730 [Candidatus Lambdaproteobacteria bacterium RIFOXYD2_FULL_50_16]OGG98057.1 MAG: hypothetical protein A2508_05810 [Candidatus Lambdaproteobacteria bacterium RIFOXYD12_FULL_49_8]